MSYTTFNEVLSKVKTSEDLKSLNQIAVTWLYNAFAEWENFELPEGTPPYNQLTGGADLAYEKLLSPKMIRMIDHFKNPSLSRLKRETLFIQTLESLSADEAKLLIAIKDKKVTELFPVVTRELVDETFPKLLVLPAGRTL